VKEAPAHHSGTHALLRLGLESSQSDAAVVVVVVADDARPCCHIEKSVGVSVVEDTDGVVHTGTENKTRSADGIWILHPIQLDQLVLVVASRTERHSRRLKAVGAWVAEQSSAEVEVAW